MSQIPQVLLYQNFTIFGKDDFDLDLIIFPSGASLDILQIHFFSKVFITIDVNIYFRTGEYIDIYSLM